MSAGHFVPFLLTYENKSATDQAREILREASRHLDGDATGVGITYSANHQQTGDIRAVYARGDWHTQTAGANQAGVMAAMEQLEATEHPELQGKVRIVPITTMTYTDFGGKTLDEVIDHDMAAVEALLDAGWTVLGWINQAGSERYAVGGGVSADIHRRDPTKALSPEQTERIQAALAGFARRYPPEQP